MDKEKINQETMKEINNMLNELLSSGMSISIPTEEEIDQKYFNSLDELQDIESIQDIDVPKLSTEQRKTLENLEELLVDANVISFKNVPLSIRIEHKKQAIHYCEEIKKYCQDNNIEGYYELFFEHCLLSKIGRGSWLEKLKDELKNLEKRYEKEIQVSNLKNAICEILPSHQGINKKDLASLLNTPLNLLELPLKHLNKENKIYFQKENNRITIYSNTQSNNLPT